MVRQTELAQTIDIAAYKAKYDECAKKLLTYDVIIAWILKSCTMEFSQYSISYIMENCIAGNAEISQSAVHQNHQDKDALSQNPLGTVNQNHRDKDELLQNLQSVVRQTHCDKDDLPQNPTKNNENTKQIYQSPYQDKIGKLDGNRSIDGLNTEAVSITEQTVYFDIRFKAVLPDKDEPIQIIVNLEIQANDTPGYPLVTRGFYYCARMISEQYGKVFTNEHYEKLQKVYSIWICPEPAKKRQNGIYKYHTVEENIIGTPYTEQSSYDLMEVVILNLGDAKTETKQEILDLLNVLFSSDTPPDEKKKILNDEFNIAMTTELESEVKDMCNLSMAIENRGLQRGLQRGIQQGLEQGEQLGLQRGLEQGEQLGLQRGEDTMAQLLSKLLSQGRMDDVQRVAVDAEYRRRLIQEMQSQEISQDN